MGPGRPEQSIFIIVRRDWKVWRGPSDLWGQNKVQGGPLGGRWPPDKGGSSWGEGGRIREKAGAHTYWTPLWLPFYLLPLTGSPNGPHFPPC